MSRFGRSGHINGDCQALLSEPSPMLLPSLASFDLLFQTLSVFDVTLIVLATSFVSASMYVLTFDLLTTSSSQVSQLCFRHLEPRSKLPLLVLLILVPSLLSIPISYHIGHPFASVPLSFSSYGSFLVFFTVSYRLSPLHPLAKYPGPVVSKISKWWGAYVSARGDLHLYYKSLHDRHGDVVRVGSHTCLGLS